jgi:hypothetical protein
MESYLSYWISISAIPNSDLHILTIRIVGTSLILNC